MKRFLPENVSGNRYGKRTMILGSLFCTAILCCGCGAYPGAGGRKEPVQSIDTAMGTMISQTVYTEDGGVTGSILREITDLEEQVLSRRMDTSELYRINEGAGNKDGIPLSGQMADIIGRCLTVSAASEGTFDITIGEVVRLWDIDSWAGRKEISGYELPEEAELKEGLSHAGYEKLRKEDSVLFLPKGMQLDMGAVGKGIALDSVCNYMEQHDDITGAVISVGGSVLTYGRKPDGSEWKVGIVNPQETSGNLGYLSLSGQWCVSTSGDYERYVEVDGVRYHHIIDPATGYPADSGLSSVTILTKDGLMSDALSTACFILGQEKGSRLAEQFGAEALFVDCEGNISMTDGMQEYFSSNSSAIK